MEGWEFVSRGSGWEDKRGSQGWAKLLSTWDVGGTLLWWEAPSTPRVPAAATVSTSDASYAPHTPPKEPTARMPPDTSNVSRGAIVPAENHQFRQKRKTTSRKREETSAPRALPTPDASFTNRHLRGPSRPWERAHVGLRGLDRSDPLPELPPAPASPLSPARGNPRVPLTEPSEALAPTLSPRAFQHTSKMPPVPR